MSHKCPTCGHDWPQESLELTVVVGLVEMATFPLANGREYPVYETLVREFKSAYPGVDIPAEFRKIRAWLVSNPTKRKTCKGMARFLNNWLSNAQNNQRTNGNGKQPQYEVEREQMRRVMSQPKP